MTKEILLNIMYTGTYLEGTNIGHEIINLFRDDNGNNYIYVLPYGSMSKIHNDTVESILLVRRCNSKIIEILAKATGLKQIPYFDKPYVGEERKRQHQLQVNYIDNNKITYNGLKPYKIFENNDGNIACLYVTFKAEEVRKVAKPIYITTDSSNKNCYFMEDIEHFPSQSPKMYITNELKSYKILEDIINDESNWEDKNTTPKVKDILKNKEFLEEDKSNFIEIIKQEYDELTYSNLFSYIFASNISGFHKFAKEVLGINEFDGDLTIEREKANIDLLLTDNINAIVIENKIKSNINGVCDRHNIGSELIQSQLKKYQKYVETHYSSNNKYYFIFAPNYNHINLNNYECGKNYKLIVFKKIYDFFVQNKKLYKNTPYFPEFIFALKKHIKPVDNSHEENMYKRFCNTIEEIKSKEKSIKWL